MPQSTLKTYNGVPLPEDGEAIQYADGKFTIPDHPIIPFIEGDGTGRDIWKASQRVFDAAVEKAYAGKRSVKWYEIYAGEKAFSEFGNWLPDESVNAARDLRVSIKGPLTTPVGGGIRSLNVALRQILDLYACVRPVKYYSGVPSPVKHPEKLDIVLFRENTEDVYAGIEFKEGSEDAKRLIDFLNDDLLKATKKRVRADSGVGIKPISIFGTKRLVRAVQAMGVPVIYFGVETAGLLTEMASTGADVIGLDWRQPLDEGWRAVGPNHAVQGNLDPITLFAPLDVLERRVHEILRSANGRPGHIFNLGHGIVPTTPVENVQAVVKMVRDFRLDSSSK